MDANDLDLLLNRLRHEPHRAPASLAENVISRLGPSSRQLKGIFLGGMCACLLGITLSAAITLKVTRESAPTAPPQLTLFSEGIGPFASL